MLLFAFTLTSNAVAVTGLTTIDDVRGPWVEGGKRKVAVWIDDCNGLLCGRIYWLKKPLSASGSPKRDAKNPDPMLRNRLLCGLTILSDFRREQGDTWRTGQIYNPSDGRTFSGTLSLENNGVLKVRGYVGLSLFGKTVTWVRPTENIKSCG